jgi:hypothetical protein
MKGQFCKIAILVRDGFAQLLHALEIGRHALNNNILHAHTTSLFGPRARVKVAAGGVTRYVATAAPWLTARILPPCRRVLAVVVSLRPRVKPPALFARGCITFTAAALSQIRNRPTLCPLSYDVRTAAPPLPPMGGHVPAAKCRLSSGDP